jgi:hypothetical protein
MSLVSYIMCQIRLSKSHNETKLWASQNIFTGRTTFDFWPNMAISDAEPYVAAPRPRRRPGKAHGKASPSMGAQA